MRPLESHAIRAQTKSFGILGWVFYCEPGWPKTVRGTAFSEVCSHNDMDGARWKDTQEHNGPPPAIIMNGKRRRKDSDNTSLSGAKQQIRDPPPVGDSIG